MRGDDGGEAVGLGVGGKMTSHLGKQWHIVYF